MNRLSRGITRDRSRTPVPRWRSLSTDKATLMGEQGFSSDDYCRRRTTLTLLTPASPKIDILNLSQNQRIPFRWKARLRKHVCWLLTLEKGSEVAFKVDLCFSSEPQKDQKDLLTKLPKSKFSTAQYILNPHLKKLVTTIRPDTFQMSRL